LAQVPSVFGKLSTFDNLCGFLRLLGHEETTASQRSRELLAEFGLTEQASLPAGQLSGGQKRRMEIARSLLAEPRLILMDEPFSGIDPVTVDHVRQLIRQLGSRGIAVLITEHRVIETVTLTDRCYVIYDGKVLVEGRPTDVLQHPDAHRAYFGKGGDEALLKLAPTTDRQAA
jgi:lipopolysaccharide export system ATP-binding protein